MIFHLIYYHYLLKINLTLSNSILLRGAIIWLCLLKYLICVYLKTDIFLYLESNFRKTQPRGLSRGPRVVCFGSRASAASYCESFYLPFIAVPSPSLLSGNLVRKKVSIATGFERQTMQIFSSMNIFFLFIFSLFVFICFFRSISHLDLYLVLIARNFYEYMANLF